MKTIKKKQTNSYKIYSIYTCYYIVLLSLFFISCNKNETQNVDNTIIFETFKGAIDLNNIPNYANQTKPNYITRDNTTNNAITNEGALLGRVLFYDKNLSVNNTISCASCHNQKFAFSDTNIASPGINGFTPRHSMRLINARFSEEVKFFWDERATSLENQTTQPIQDHTEMGFSGLNGDPSIQDLITKLSKIKYYQELFKLAFNSPDITEAKIQNALAQFMRSIQSFDSKYDLGRVQVAADNINFPNFTAQENMGKQLFLSAPVFDANSLRISGGLGCQACHRAPEFDIDPKSLSNGIGGSIAGGGPDNIVFRAPTLRDLVKTDGTLNTALMHTAAINSLQAAIGHYGNLTTSSVNNPNLDPRLKPNGKGQQLQLTATEVNAVIAFLKTLSGSDVYINSKWSNPFP
ncbi:MAG: cytochrome c peroxidase [Alphaproteobacteria bacterium]|nr:cytochrome c peroxidase [Alphaproteobacteria bacterium]